MYTIRPCVEGGSPCKLLASASTASPRLRREYRLTPPFVIHSNGGNRYHCCTHVQERPMFAAPPAIEAEVFATIPDKYLKRGIQNDWVDVQFAGQDIPSFLEGPCFDAEGNLWVVDIPWGRLF